MNKKALVTGGAGYIGGHTALALQDSGWEIVVLDNLATGSRDGILPNWDFYEGDINDGEILDKIFGEHAIGAVLHFAAVAAVPECEEFPDKCTRVNVQGTQSVADAAVKHQIPYFVFSSTCALYDESSPPPFSEESPVKPANRYGASKLAGEEYLGRQKDLLYAVLRYFNVGGVDAGQRIGNSKQHDTTLIKSALEVASGKRSELQIHGTDYPTPDGTCVRDYVHVSDIAAAHVLALEYLARGGESGIFNLGIGTGYSVKEVVAVAKKVSGVDFKTSLGPRRKGDPAGLYSNSEKAKKLLGFNPQYTDLEEIVKTAWRWESRQDLGD